MMNFSEPFCPLQTMKHGAMENRTHFIGETANITCQANYTLVGSEEVTCLANRTWTEIPVCTSKKTIFTGFSEVMKAYIS
jgi:hypothetical protein